MDESEKLMSEIKEMRGIKKSYEIYIEVNENVNVLHILARFFNCFSDIKRIGRNRMIMDKHCYLKGIIDNRQYNVSFESNYISIECNVFDKYFLQFL